MPKTATNSPTQLTLMELLHPQDGVKAGRSRLYLAQLARRGLLERIGRGLYTHPDRSQVTEHTQLAQISCKHSGVVYCLLTALSYHGLTTQLPWQVWFAIANKARAPKIDYAPTRIVRFGPPSIEAGVEHHIVEGVEIKVTNVAKTVVDCFKFRNKIGLDVALEALKEAWQEKRVTMSELEHYAEICRVRNVMKPYLELLVA